MFPNQFDYHRPDSVQEAVASPGGRPGCQAAGRRAFAVAGDEAAPGVADRRWSISAGSTDCRHHASRRQRHDRRDDDLRAAARTRASWRRRCRWWLEAADNVGDPAVQARGTLGGALAHSDPAADFTAVFLALNGSVEVTGGSRRADDRGRRAVRRSVHDLAGAGRDHHVGLTSRQPGERQGRLREVRHPASGYAVVGVAAVVDRRLATAPSIRRGSPSPARRARRRGRPPPSRPWSARGWSRRRSRAAAAVAGDGLEINGDHFASAEYRAHLVGVATRRALEKAAG